MLHVGQTGETIQYTGILEIMIWSQGSDNYGFYIQVDVVEMEWSSQYSVTKPINI